MTPSSSMHMTITITITIKVTAPMSPTKLGLNNTTQALPSSELCSMDSMHCQVYLYPSLMGSKFQPLYYICLSTDLPN